MTSVQKFLRQRSQANTLFSAPTNDCYYVFVPTAGNYVGNYPPGYMVAAGVYGAAPDPSGLLIRDMGKTIKAPLADATTGVLGASATSGFFREIQLISPVTVASATASSNFGIIGNAAQTFGPGNVGDSGYNTLYIPIIIDGTVASSAGTSITAAVLPSPYLSMGGQM